VQVLRFIAIVAALGAAAVLVLLYLAVWAAEPAALEHLRRDVAYGWLLIQTAPLIGIGCGLTLCAALVLGFMAWR
jgi:hypothetical protein